MNRATRYVLSLLVAGLITAFAAIRTDSILLLAAIGQVYAVGTAIILRSEMRQLARAAGGSPDTIFGGVTVFSVLAVAQSFSTEFHFASAILTFGLALFGFFCGMWSTITEDD